MQVKQKTVYSVNDFELTFEPLSDTINIEKTKKGYTVKYLIYDTDGESPRNWGNLGHMVCFHGRYDLGDSHTYNKDDYGSWNDLKDAICRSGIVPIILPLFLYDHSGVSIKTVPHGYHGSWDCGQVGFIFVTKEQIKKEYGTVNAKNIEQAKKVLLGEVENYNQYLQGDVYSCVVEQYDRNKNHLDYDVVGGCYGFGYALKALKEEI